MDSLNSGVHFSQYFFEIPPLQFELFSPVLNREKHSLEQKLALAYFFRDGCIKKSTLQNTHCLFSLPPFQLFADSPIRAFVAHDLEQNLPLPLLIFEICAKNILPHKLQFLFDLVVFRPILNTSDSVLRIFDEEAALRKAVFKPSLYPHNRYASMVFKDF